MSRIAKTIAICCLLSGAPAYSQAAERPDRQPVQAPDPMAEAARLYDSLDARPGWPTTLSEAEVDAGLARQGLRPEQRRSIIALMRQDICRLPEMVPICRYYGAETIYKIQRLGWARRARDGRPTDPPGTDVMVQQMQLMEYGGRRNLERLYGENGLSDAREAELNNAAGASRAAAGFSSGTNAWFACGTDTRTLPQTGFPQQYRLTTCGAGFGFFLRFAIFGVEWGFEWNLLVTHSRFARKVVLWLPTGAEPTICANSVLNGAGNLACNPHRWYSPPSFKQHSTTNLPMSVVSTGTAMRLNQPFNVTIVHQ